MAHVQNFAARDALLEMLRGADELAAGQARLAMESLPADIQADMLIEMLAWDSEEDVRFAVRQLGRLRQPKALWPLLQAMITHQETELQVEILKSLAKFRDARCVRALERIAIRSGGRIQTEALEVLNNFSRMLHSRFIRRCLDSAVDRIREFAFVTAVKQKSRYWEKLVGEKLKREPLEAVRSKTLTSLRSIRVRELWQAVFDLSLNDPSFTVRLNAVSVLQRIHSNAVCAGLVKHAFRDEGAKQLLAIRLLASYLGDSKIRAGLYRLYERTQTPAVRLEVLAVLGERAHPETFRFLQSVVDGNGDDAYAAALSLTEILRESDWDTVESLLDRSREVPGPVRQAVLYWICRLNEEMPVPVPVSSRIMELLKDRDRAVRYMAVRAYARIGRADPFEKLLTISIADPEKSIRYISYAEAVLLAHRDPEQLCKALPIAYISSQLAKPCAQLFVEVSVGHKTRMRDIFKQAFEILHGGLPDLQDRPWKDSALFPLLVNMVRRDASFFIELLQEPGWNSREERFLLQILAASGIVRYEGLDTAFLARAYERAPGMLRTEYLEFFETLKYPHSDLSRALVRALEQTPDVETAERLESVLVRWLAPQAPDEERTV
ncbi:MAG: hypothetical protein A2Z83_01440 [Omnitrophica bacterium GWA2_52_8]|nr:MAG: hypothetical protein A2Z83_01440 [Omnitrophica bacterium GWA2_52_8]